MSNADAKFTIADHETKALVRLPSRHQDSTNLRSLVSIHAQRTQTLEDVIANIRASILFDVDTATGVNQDQIGTILVIKREGRTDDAYRIILRTQALLVLDERRSRKRLMEVVRSLMDTDPGAIMYTQGVPKSFKLTVASATLATLVSWVPILRRCRPATYSSLLGWQLAGHMGFSNGDTLVPEVSESWTGYSNGDVLVPSVSEAWKGYSALIEF